MSAVTRHLVIADRYRDSVALMAVAARLRIEPGITDASVVMATAANLALVGAADFELPDGVRASDLLASVRGDAEACESTLALVPSLLDEPAANAKNATGTVAPAPRSLWQAINPGADPTLALISVPGPYAAAEAAKALVRGSHVMLFSDNVSVDDEVALKAYAAERGLLVMGPDCGTAIIDGVPLGFANAVRRGPIGVIGASGTGMQEIVSRIHRLGSGISHAIGTGGRDLSDAVGGRAMLQALEAIADDPGTDVLVFVSKPPSPTVLARLAERVAALRRDQRLHVPVIGAFLGAPADLLVAAGMLAAPTLAAAADMAVQFAGPLAGPDPIDRELLASMAVPPVPSDPARRFLRAAFCGGTFAYEAQLVWHGRGLLVASNAPTAGNPTLTAESTFRWPGGHAAVDFGADEFTVGRPHPMIDPARRDEALLAAWRDPSTAVVVFDVVLGHGSSNDPVGALCERLRTLQHAEPATRAVTAVAHVCGTDLDPQPRGSIVDALLARSVHVAASNAEAAAFAAGVLAAQSVAAAP